MRKRPLRPLILLVVGLVVTLPFIVYRPQVVATSSMEPLLHPGDLVLVDVGAWRLRMPSRGEIVTFLDASGHEDILRVAGIGGDTVEISDVRIRVNGVEGIPGHEEMSLRDRGPLPSGTWHVPGGMVFLLGDRRRPGRDSRQSGPVPIERLRGHARILLLPASRRGWL